MSETNSTPESTVEPSTLESTEVSQETQEESSTPEVEAAAVKPAEVKKMLKKLKLKVDKEEYDEELPFEIPDDPKAIEYMRKQLQMAKMGTKRAQQYGELESEVREFVELLRKNPKKALSDPNIGLDLKKFASEIIEEEIARAQKSPEQIAKEELEAELKALKEEREKEKEQSKKQQMEQLQAKAYKDYHDGINKCIETSGLPKSNYVVKKMADYMLFALQEGKDVSPEDVLPLVKDEIYADIKDMFATAPDEVIENMVGKDVLSRIRKKNVQKARELPPTPLKKAVLDVGSAGKKETKDDSGKKFTLKDLFDV